ncbi:MAG: hypothetical protein ABH877_00135 [bacterium]
MPPIKLGFAMPAYGGMVDLGQVNMLIDFGFQLAGNEAAFTLVLRDIENLAYIEVVRNTIMAHALEAGCDWLLSVDADCFYDPPNPAEATSLLQMVFDASKDPRVAMVGTPVRRRGNPADPYYMVYKWRTPPRVKPIPEETFLGKVVPVDCISTSLYAVNVNWIRSCWPKGPWYVVQHLGGLDYAGEDVTFCEGIRGRGGVILCDGRVLPEHVQSRQTIKPPGALFDLPFKVTRGG